MTVAQSYKRTDRWNRHRVFLAKYTYGNGDTTVTVATGLKIIYHYSVSPVSVVTKQVTDGDISGGTITLTVTDPLGTAYLTVMAIGI